MAKKQVDGDGLDIPNRIKALPVKRTGPIVAAIIVALFAAMLVQALVTNPRFEWNVVWKYLFNENVLEGIKYTLLLTVISMVIAIILAVILAVMRKSINPVLRGVSWFYPCVHAAGLLGSVRGAGATYRRGHPVHLNRILEH